MRPEKKPWSSLLCNKIIEEILSRFPVKPLIQFKCVCKEWNSLMSEPYFIKLHLSKSATKDDLEHLQLIKNSVHVMGCTVGLAKYQKDTVLFSGTRRKSCRTIFGFSYDPSSDKYKVVAIALTMLSLEVSEKTEMKVYGAGDTKVGGVYLSGTLNWVKGKETIHSEIIIISVDLEKETCRSLFLLDDFCFFDTNIGVFRDSMCVWQDSNTHLGLWQMRKFGDDKSWIQLINFSYLHLNIRPYEEKSMILPFCMSNNGDFFMLKFTRNADDEYQTILYNQRDALWLICFRHN
ncbi:hypothetical protein AAZX31_U008400 [Glycine max]|uniref:F-box domain-containing protein n=1 Tax=Glycine max TaxID=3847 RepID=A0A0R0F0M8_SOYBN